MLDLRPHFRRFLGADPQRLHLAAHSHHPWPDATREAQLAAWDDAARLADGKWERVLGPVWAEAQGHVARHLGLPDPATIVFAQSTFELWLRLLSCFPPGRPIRALTTDGEFHSFRRLAARLAEDGLMEVETVATAPLASFAARFAEAAGRGGRDLILFSQVFFDSGFAVAELGEIAAAAPAEAFVAIDGYHGFLAVPTDLGPIAGRVFYMAGGYKYAMAGEGAAFLHCPPGWGPRPRATGWFAEFAALSGRPEAVAYPEDARRFMGATFDPSGLYRFNAAMRWLAEAGLDAAAVQAHAHALQAAFVDALRQPLGELVVALEELRRGSFLAFRRPDAAEAQARLARAGIVTDARGDRLRLGFGLHHAAPVMPLAAARVEAALR